MSRHTPLRPSRKAWLAGLLVVLLACVSPTLPPDDPPEPSIELGVGVARLSGYVGEGPAFVLVHNRDTGLIFGQRTATGVYDFEVQTEPCDLLALWYTAGSFQSTQVRFRPADVVGGPGVCRRQAIEGDAGEIGGDE